MVKNCTVRIGYCSQVLLSVLLLFLAWSAGCGNGRLVLRNNEKNKQTSGDVRGKLTGRERQEAMLLADRLEAILRRKVWKYWFEHGIDRRYGGFRTTLGRDWTPYSTGKCIIGQLRMVYVLSRASMVFPGERRKWLPMARTGLDFILAHYWDKKYGGWFMAADQQGRVTADFKKLYSQVFAIYALATYYQVSGDKSVVPYIEKTFDLVQKHLYNRDLDFYFHRAGRAWKPIRPATQMGDHLHYLEAMLALYRALPRETYRREIRHVVDIIHNKMWSRQWGIPYEFFTPEMKVDRKRRSWTTDLEAPVLCIGHQTEMAFFLMQAAELDKARPYAERCVALIDQVFKLSHLDEWGYGIPEWMSVNGKLSRETASFWCQAEGIGACAKALLVSKNRKYLKCIRKLLKTFDYFEDKEYGGYAHYIKNPEPTDNFTEEKRRKNYAKPNRHTPFYKGHGWACCYHVTRSLTHAIESLRMVGKESSVVKTAGGGNTEEWVSLPLTTEAQRKMGIKGGEGFQQVTDIVYAPSNPKIVYLCSDTSQVWKSVDGGHSWKMCHRGFYAEAALSVAVDPFNADVVFAAGSLGRKIRYKMDAQSCSGIFHSLNGGRSWQLIKKVRYFGKHQGRHFVFMRESFDGTRCRTVYAGTWKDGFLKSTDGGETWDVVGLKEQVIFDVRLRRSGAARAFIFIATDRGLFSYDTRKKNLRKIGDGLPACPRSIALDQDHPETMFVAVGEEGIFRSDDNGRTFAPSSQGLDRSNRQAYLYVSASPVDPKYMYASCSRDDVNPFWSHDGGVTWHRPTTIDKGNLCFYSGRWFAAHIEPHPLDKNTALSCANGHDRIIRTSDGGLSWSFSGSGYTGGRAGVGKASFAFFRDGKKLVIFLIDMGPFFTDNGGESFRRLEVPRYGTHSTPVGAACEDGRGNVVIVTAVGSWNRSNRVSRGKQIITVSNDGGRSWRQFPKTAAKYRFIGIHPQKPNVFYAQNWITKDSGKSFQPVKNKVCAIYPGNGDIVYAVKKTGGNQVEIVKSMDCGQTWSSPYKKLAVNDPQWVQIDIDPRNPDRIYAATQNGLYICDGGEWQRRDERNGLLRDHFGSLNVKNVVVDPRHPEIVYVGMWAPGRGHSNGVFRSMDYGKTWHNITYNLGPEINCWALAVNPNNGTVYFGSSHGTWMLPPPY